MLYPRRSTSNLIMARNMDHNSQTMQSQVPISLKSNSVSGFSYHSPVHAAAIFPKVATSVSTMNKSSGESVVGSRLANYDLSLSGLHRTVNQCHMASETIKPTAVSHIAIPNDNLLIGEEDKYSALRDLVQHSPQQFQCSDVKQEVKKGYPNFNSCLPDKSVQHSFDLTKTEGLEVATADISDVASDFGDFQSFSNSSIVELSSEFKERSSIHTSLCAVPSSLSSKNMGIKFMNDNGMNTLPSTNVPDFQTSSNCAWSADLPISERNSLSTDVEFGDFVSFTNGDMIASNVIDSVNPKLLLSNTVPNKISSPPVLKSKSATYEAPKISIILDKGTEETPKSMKSRVDRFSLPDSKLNLNKPESFGELLKTTLIGTGESEISYSELSSASLSGTNNSFMGNQVRVSFAARPCSVDKYQCFKEEMEIEKERYGYEWSRCLQCCLQIITYAINVFNSTSSSEVIREVVCNEKGNSYILNLIEIYLVASRIHRAQIKLGGDANVQQLHMKISLAWESLTPFLLGTPLMKDVSMVDEWAEGEYVDHSKVCGVCLISTEKDKPNELIDYGGKYYHSTCSNLWINEVDSILPSLSYVSF